MAEVLDAIQGHERNEQNQLHVVVESSGGADEQIGDAVGPPSVFSNINKTEPETREAFLVKSTVIGVLVDEEKTSVNISESELSECHACNTSLTVKRERGKETFCSEKCTMTAEEIRVEVGEAVLSKDREVALLDRRGDDAQMALNVMQKLLEANAPQRNQIRRLIMKLSIRSKLLPASLLVGDVTLCDTESVAGGGFADIFRGVYKDKPVALKRLRVFRASIDIAAWEEFYHEAIIWRNLDHQHVLPLLGIDDHTFKQSLCMVIPWMPYGNIRSVIDKLKLVDEKKLTTPDAPVLQTHKWLRQIARGLTYLHQECIVHGDLRGANILIDENWGVRLTDFGMAVYAEGVSHSYGSMRGGNARWLSPEIIDSEQFYLVSDRPTYASDVFSYACCCIEIFSGDAPYAGKSESQILSGIPQGLRPARPNAITGDEMSDALWELVNHCWAQLAAERPTAEEVADLISEICDTLPGIEDSGVSITDFSRRRAQRRQLSQKTGVIKATAKKLPGFLDFLLTKLYEKYPQLEKWEKVTGPLGRLIDSIFIQNFVDKVVFLFVCLLILSVFNGGSSHVFFFRCILALLRVLFFIVGSAFAIVKGTLKLCWAFLWFCLAVCWFVCWSAPKGILLAAGFQWYHSPVYAAFLFAMPKRSLIS